MATAIPTQRRWHSVRGFALTGTRRRRHGGRGCTGGCHHGLSIAMFEHVRSLPGERAPEQHTNGGGHDNHDRIGGQTHWPGTTAIVDADRAGRRIIEGILRYDSYLWSSLRAMAVPSRAQCKQVSAPIYQVGVYQVGVTRAIAHEYRQPTSIRRGPIRARILELHGRARVEA